MIKLIVALFFLAEAALYPGGECFIEIIPNCQPHNYEMKAGEILTFNITAYKKEGAAIYPAPFEKVWWQYDKRMLEKVSGNDVSITLKTLQRGIVQLYAASMVKNQLCQKMMSITIRQ